jgi:uncharacterized protein YkwD
MQRATGPVPQARRRPVLAAAFALALAAPDAAASASSATAALPPAVSVPGSPQAAAVPAPDVRGLARLRTAALALANAERAARGLRPLAADPALDRAAEAHAIDMLRRNYFSHVSPEGTRPQTRIRRAGGHWERTAENIAYCIRCSADPERLRTYFHAGWMRSRGHRANILHPRLDRFGFALVERGGTAFAVQVFGTVAR